ncbi:hypothetical protein BC830DRAFT_207029 [Chytriomyces sp. MP71]|nr:hypothetical protein BC830DRAFT_207029 [Chytriomyces sp. MP71]
MYPPPLRPIGVSTIVKDVRASCIPLTQASCGPDFTGALVLRSNVTLSSATTYFSYYDPRYSDETDFMNKMKAFLSPDIGLPSQLTEASKPSLKSAMARQYQATLFCTAAVFTAYQAGCYDASSAFTVGNGTYAACYGTCKTAVDTLEAAVTDRFGPQPSNVNVSQPFAPWNLVRDMQRACGMMYDHVFPDPFLLNEDSDSSLLTDSDLHCATAVDGALSGAIQEVSTCGFADKSFKDGYCKQYTARWCCQGTNFPRAYYDRDMQFSYYTNEYLSFDVWKSRTTRRETLYTRMQIGFGVFLAVFLIVAITLHVYNIRRVRSDNQQDLSLMDYIALAERSRADAPEREYTMPDTHQPDYTSFFRLMDLNLPEEGGTVLDLDRLFHLESLGWISRDGFMGRTHPAVNPYHPRSDVENRPPLLRLEDLPLATFANKVLKLSDFVS